MSVGSETSVDGTTVQLVQLADTNVLSQVDVTGNGSGSLVEPNLRLLGGQLVAGGGLDKVHVTGDLELTLSLQELGVGVDKLLSGNVTKLLVGVQFVSRDITSTADSMVTQTGSLKNPDQ